MHLYDVCVLNRSFCSCTYFYTLIIKSIWYNTVRCHKCIFYMVIHVKSITAHSQLHQACLTELMLVSTADGN